MRRNYKALRKLIHFLNEMSNHRKVTPKAKLVFKRKLEKILSKNIIQ